MECILLFFETIPIKTKTFVKLKLRYKIFKKKCTNGAVETIRIDRYIIYNRTAACSQNCIYMLLGSSMLKCGVLRTFLRNRSVIMLVMKHSDVCYNALSVLCLTQTVSKSFLMLHVARQYILQPHTMLKLILQHKATLQMAKNH